MYARKVQNRGRKSCVCLLKTQLETQHDHVNRAGGGGEATDISFDDINHLCLNFDALSFQLVASGCLGFVTSVKGRDPSSLSQVVESYVFGRPRRLPESHCEAVELTWAIFSIVSLLPQ